jgi:hypothetical protein
MSNAIEKKDKQTTLAQYGGFDLEEMEKVADELPVGGGNFFTPRQGKNVVRFVPPPLGKPATKIWYKHWFQVGNDRQGIVCTKYQYSQPCPVCDMAAKLGSSSSKVDQRKASALKPQSNVYVNIVDMMDPEKGVQLWKMSPGLFKDIKNAIEMAEVGKVFSDPVKGYNIVFKRTGENRDTEYSGHMVARESSPLPDAESLLPNQHDLETAEEAPTDEQQEAAVDGKYEERGGKEKGDRKGGGKGRGGRSQRNDGLGSDEDEEDADIDV